MGRQLVLKGFGPAAALLAIRAVQRGFSIVAYDPSFTVGSPTPFPGTYGVFTPQIPSWADPLFGPPTPLGIAAGSPPRQRVLGFTNRMLDQEAVVETLDRYGVQIIPEALPDGMSAIDCTGAPRTDVALWQLAVGWFFPFDNFDFAPTHPKANGVLMDWAVPDLKDPSAPPSFFYAQRTSEGWLFEETILATHCNADPASQQELFTLLRERLAQRCSWKRLTEEQVIREEQVSIPMGTRRRHKGKKFGAAAGFINPATGYSLGHALEAVDEFLDDRPLGGWAAYTLRQIGGELIARADGETLQDFFGHFFALDTRRQLAYLTGRDGLAVARTMWALRKGAGLRHKFLRPLFCQPWSVAQAVWARR